MSFSFSPAVAAFLKDRRTTRANAPATQNPSRTAVLQESVARLDAILMTFAPTIKDDELELLGRVIYGRDTSINGGVIQSLSQLIQDFGDGLPSVAQSHPYSALAAKARTWHIAQRIAIVDAVERKLRQVAGFGVKARAR